MIDKYLRTHYISAYTRKKQFYDRIQQIERMLRKKILVITGEFNEVIWNYNDFQDVARVYTVHDNTNTNKERRCNLVTTWELAV